MALIEAARTLGKSYTTLQTDKYRFDDRHSSENWSA